MDDRTKQFVLVRDLDGSFDTRQSHARGAVAGTEVRVANGAYVERRVWEEFTATERYLAQVRAVALTRRNRPVLSYWSAAAVHGLPIFGSWPDAVHITIGRTTGGRSWPGLRRHAVRIPDEHVTEIDGMLVTTLARTVVDLATVADRLTAAMAVDRSLLVDRFGRRPPMTTLEELQRTWESCLPFRGYKRSLDGINNGKDRSESPLESVSRFSMRILGCPVPELQRSYWDDEGFVGDTDFSWPKYNAAAEADGETKYLDEAMRSGRSVEHVILDEKYREDRLRALGLSFTRWNWQVGVNPTALRPRLQLLSLPLRP